MEDESGAGLEDWIADIKNALTYWGVNINPETFIGLKVALSQVSQKGKI